MNTAELIEEVHKFTDPEWKIEGVYQRPDINRIKLMLIALNGLLAEQQDDLSQVESGGIIVRRDGTHIDVFVHVGELDLDTEVTI